MMFTLPPGWGSERIYQGAKHVLFVLRLPNNAGYITVDFTKRRFAPGHRGSFALSEAKSSLDPWAYTGRGWRQRLVNDAVAWAKAEGIV